MKVAGISFLRPDLFWAVPAAAIVAAIWVLIRRRRFLSFSAVRFLQQLPHRASILRRTPAVLVLGAIALIVVALADPVLPYSEAKIQSQGLDIVLVVDLSSSMMEVMGVYTEGVPAVTAANGKQPTRLEVTKNALKDFISRRRDDRIGLVVFSDNAYVVSPLTFDYEYLRAYIDGIDDQLLRMEGMTAIGEGMHLGNVLLARQSERGVRNKVMVILTDGEHNIGRDPIEVLGDVDAAGVRAHLIGVDLEKVIRGRPAVVKLIDTVRHYGGQYFQANSARQLLAANAALERLEEGRLVGRRFESNVPIFMWFAIPATVLIVAACALRAIPYFVDFT